MAFALVGLVESRRRAPCARSSWARQGRALAVAPRDHHPPLWSQSCVALLAAALLSGGPTLPVAAVDTSLPASVTSVAGVAPAAAATYSLDDDDPSLPTGMARGLIADVVTDTLFPDVVFPELLPEGFLPTDATRENPDALPDIIALDDSNLIRDGSAAFAASALATALLHPLDTVKCRLQSGAYTVEPLCGAGGCVLGIPIPELPKLRRRRSKPLPASSSSRASSRPGYAAAALYSP